MVSQYTFGDYLVRVEDGVIEQFTRSIASSYRVPLAWAGAEFENRKHEVVRVRIGVAADPSASFFSSLAFANTMFSLEVPSSEAPRLREFLSEVARTAARVV